MSLKANTYIVYNISIYGVNRKAMWLQQTYRRHYTHAIKYIVHTLLQIKKSLIISLKSIQVLIENSRGTEILFKKRTH